MKGKDFVFIGNQPWDVPIGSNCKNIAEVVARNNRVLYVNMPLNRFTLLRNNADDREFIENRKAVLKGKKKPLNHIKDGLYTYDPPVVIESINFLPDGALYDYFNRRNNWKIYREILKGTKELEFKDFILFNDSEMFQGFYAPEMLRPALSVYYSRDNLISTDYFKKHGVRLEPQLIAKYDLCTSNSLYLKDYCAQHNSNSYYVGQGCDLSIFDPEKEYDTPSDFKNITQPIIGYIGALLKLRLDIELLENLAEKHPEWSLVLVGPEDEHFQASKLHQMKNVHFLGSKKPGELGHYLAPFDVAINPQSLNPMTVGNYPRKIDEYLALGKPTVATKTRAMEIFADHVYLAEGLEDYESCIQRALDENSPEKEKARIELARSHSWENSVDEIYRAIEQHY